MFKTCGQKQQSPINIYEGDVVTNTNIPPFKFTNYDANLTLQLSNSGHGALVSIAGSTLASISGGGLVGTYNAVQFHFHWGNLSSAGSEHLISSEDFPMELHIVHYNSKYEHIGRALPNPDGLAVLGFVFAISDTGDNGNYADLVENLAKIKNPDKTAQLTPTALNSFLPASFPHFYRYPGSLTTPTCEESVTWTVFKEPIHVSEKQGQHKLFLKNHQKNKTNLFTIVHFVINNKNKNPELLQHHLIQKSLTKAHLGILCRHSKNSYDVT
ncbi:unnamed protein product [Lymnaea stagnalis]|uniref:Carbonic anhydrase n=1 Tax=Lymnaea stagnalis TaxID=6523 RepID=A0AAV2HVP2_LYMST